jgi:hypothetical protein
VSQFTVLEGPSLAPSGDPVALTQALDSVLNAGLGGEYWLHGVSAEAGPKSGGTVLYGAFSTDFSASPEIVPGEASASNQNHYHVTAGSAFSIGSSRFSLGLSYAFGTNRNNFALGGLPPEVPVITEKREVDVTFSRLVFVLGYAFGR